MKKKVLALFMTAAMAVLAVACGNTQSTSTGDNAGAADGKVWVIATDTVFKPFEYTDDKGNFVGIDVDILAAVAEDQGFKYELKSLGWDASIAACQAGQADGMIAGASITDERKASGWIFSNGYFDATQSMAVAADSDIKGFPGAAGKVTGTVRVISDISHLDEVKKGDILVTGATNIGWTLVFPKVSAIITDIGAPLSHAAIVAREFGIPAVVGCRNATTVLKTGDIVTVDGGLGTVTIEK